MSKGRCSCPRDRVTQFSDAVSCEDLGHCSYQGGLTCTQRTPVLGHVQYSSPALAFGHTLGLQRKPPDQMQPVRHHQKQGTPGRGPVVSDEREDYWYEIIKNLFKRQVSDVPRPQPSFTTVS